MITFIIDEEKITVANNTLKNFNCLVNESDNEIVFDDCISNCYLEYCDNSDEYDRDEEGYKDWIKFSIDDDGNPHRFIDDTNGDIDVVEFLKSFSCVNVIVKNDRGAEICCE